MIGRLHVVRRLHVSSVSICLSLLVEGQTPQLYGRLQPKVRHLESTVCPSYLCPCYFLSVHGVAAVYVSIGRLHSLSVFYRASHNTPATPPPRRPQNRPHPNPQANPGKSHTTVPRSPPKKCGATPSKIHQGTKARTAPRPTRKEAPHNAHPRHPRPPGSRETNKSKAAQVPRDTLQICILFDQVNIFGYSE